MKKSDLENFNDRILISIIKKVLEKIDLSTIENSSDWTYHEEINSIFKLLSIDNSFENDDYIYNVWLLNEDMFVSDSFDSKLTRPTLKNYEYNWKIRVKKIVDEYYRNTMVSYSDPSQIQDILYNLRSEGTLDIFDGDMYDEDERDSDLIDDDLMDVKEI